MAEQPEAAFERQGPDGSRQYSLTWKGADGNTCSAEGNAVSISSSGIVIACAPELAEGCTVYIECRDGSVQGECEVINCSPKGAFYNIGLAFLSENMWKPGAEGEAAPDGCEADYYEVLQISRKADTETIHRVYRIMAARFHPDNTETGDLETFLQMKKAYTVLSDPELRTEYDRKIESEREGPRPIFARKAFVTGVEAEANRRLGVLALLYNQRQSDSEHPSILLLDLEREMGFPREYLNFAMWYLRAKEYVVMADNSDFAITAGGAEYLEKKAARTDIVGNLLHAAADRGGRPHQTAKDRPKTRIDQRRYLLA
jgi:curved DNA-binding protein CbpA